MHPNRSMRLACRPMAPEAMTPAEARAAGREIKTARMERGLSQAALALATGVDPTTVGRIERGAVSQPTKLVVLQKYLRVGSYALESDPIDDLDVTAMATQQLVKLMHRVSAEVADRYERGEDEPPTHRSPVPPDNSGPDSSAPKPTRSPDTVAPDVIWSDRERGRHGKPPFNSRHRPSA